MPRNGAVTLADLQARGLDRLEVDCTRCQRVGSQSIATALDRWGDDLLSDILRELTADCRYGKSPTSFDRCGAYYPALRMPSG
jgi:hypothetical protein